MVTLVYKRVQAGVQAVVRCAYCGGSPYRAIQHGVGWNRNLSTRVPMGLTFL